MDSMSGRRPRMGTTVDSKNVASGSGRVRRRGCGILRRLMPEKIGTGMAKSRRAAAQRLQQIVPGARPAFLPICLQRIRRRRHRILGRKFQAVVRDNFPTPGFGRTGKTLDLTNRCRQCNMPTPTSIAPDQSPGRASPRTAATASNLLHVLIRSLPCKLNFVFLQYPATHRSIRVLRMHECAIVPCKPCWMLPTGIQNVASGSGRGRWRAGESSEG